MGWGVSMFINSRINYLCRDDIKLDLEFINVLAIEIPKDLSIGLLVSKQNCSHINLLNFCNFLIERINIFVY